VKTALITSVTGQDGTYLAQLLFNKSYKVYGNLQVKVNPAFARANEVHCLCANPVKPNALLAACAVLQCPPLAQTF
jgi:GDP-D-mannose dehydratase